MSTEYRFFTTVAGISYFARVVVEIDRSSNTVRAIDAIGEVNLDTGETKAALEPGRVQAAIAGAQEALDALIAAKALTGGCLVRITKIVGSVLDTRADTVMCAAALATWKAVCPHSPPPEPVFACGHWTLKCTVSSA